MVGNVDGGGSAEGQLVQRCTVVCTPPRECREAECEVKEMNRVWAM